MPTLDEIRGDLFGTETPGTRANLQQRIIAQAQQYGLDPALMLALSQHESGFNPRAKSPSDVEGLFQVTVDTGKPYGQTAQNRTNPDVSMQAGMQYFRKLLQETKGDVRQALARYGDPNVPDYADRVLSHYAVQAGQVPQNAQTQRLMAQTQRFLRSPSPQQARTQPQSLEDIRKDLGFSAPPPPAAPPPEAAPVQQPPPPATEQSAGRQLDPRTMDDDALLQQIGANPELVKQSKFYRPGSFQQMLTTPESAMEWLMRSPVGSVLSGFRKPVEFAAQAGTRGLSALGALDQSDVAFVDAMVNLLHKEYQQSPRTNVQVPFVGQVNPGELAGQMLFPIPGVGPAAQPGAGMLRNIGAAALRGAETGAIGGAAQPVYQPGVPGTPDDTFFQQTGQRALGGALIGGGLGAGVGTVAGLANKFDNARRTGTMTKVVEEEAEALQQSLRQTPYASLQEIQQAAARGSTDANNLLDAIAASGDDWQKIMQTSGDVALFQKKLQANANYNEVARLTQGLGNAPVPRTLKTIDDAIAKLEAEPLPDRGTIATLKEMRSDISPISKQVTVPPPVGSPLHTPPSTTTVTTPADTTYGRLRDLDTKIRDRISDYYSPAQNAMVGVNRIGKEGLTVLPEVRKALEAEMDQFVTSKGVPEATAALRHARNYYRQEVAPYHDRMLANAFKNEFSDEVYKHFVKQGAGERAQYYYDALDPKGRAAVRYGLVQEAYEQALDPVTQRLNTAKFTKYMRDRQEAQDVFFTGREKWHLDGVTNLLRQEALMKSRGQALPLFSLLSTSAVLPAMGAVGGGTAGAVAALPVVGGLAAAKALMSTEAGRRFLVAASSTQPGSSAFQRLMDRALDDLPRAIAIETQQEGGR